MLHNLITVIDMIYVNFVIKIADSGFKFWLGYWDFLFTSTFRLVLGSTQSSIRWIPGLFLWG
jgi:hypothetical protein